MKQGLHTKGVCICLKRLSLTKTIQHLRCWHQSPNHFSQMCNSAITRHTHPTPNSHTSIVRPAITSRTPLEINDLHFSFTYFIYNSITNKFINQVSRGSAYYLPVIWWQRITIYHLFSCDLNGSHADQGWSLVVEDLSYKSDEVRNEWIQLTNKSRQLQLCIFVKRLPSATNYVQFHLEDSWKTQLA